MKNLLREICASAVSAGAAFADARVLESESTGITRQDGRSDKLSQGSSRGLGIRVLKGHAWGFASVSEIDRDSALDTLAAAVLMAEASSARSEEAVVAEVRGIEDHVRSDAEIDPRNVSVERKMAALRGYEEAAIKLAGDKLANSVVSYSDRFQREIVCNTAGTYIENESIRTILHAVMVASDGTMLQRGAARVGEPGGFELVERTPAEELSVKAAKLACALLKASPPPAGKFPVVFHPSVAGLLTHEAIGHNAEADHILSGTSIIADKLGTKVASDLITIVDDSTIPGKWGSYRYDSEGTPSARRVLVDKGVLMGYMNSLETAARLGVLPNGSARAQGYSNRPIVRMSNTFIEPGSDSFEEMLRRVDLGVYLKGAEYGYVFCERGQFTCHAGEAYMIRNGEIAEHLRDVSVVGMTLEALMNIDSISSDFEMKMPGMCGKGGQGMPVDDGGPHVLMSELVVGGRA